MKRAFVLGFVIGGTVVGGISAIGCLRDGARPVAAANGQERWPNVLPRPTDTTMLYEDARIIVWDDLLPMEHFFHKHARDSVVISIADGPEENVDAEGRILPQGEGVHSGPVPRFVGFSHAGNGPHSERSTDPNHRRRHLRIEFKGTEPADCRQWSTDPYCNRKP